MTIKITASNFKAINRTLYKLGAVYHDGIPMDAIFNAIKGQGLVPLQEDNTEWDGFLCGTDGRCYIPVGDALTKTKKNGLDMYEPFKNRALALSWHKMESSRYEIVAYI